MSDDALKELTDAAPPPSEGSDFGKAGQQTLFPSRRQTVELLSLNGLTADLCGAIKFARASASDILSKWDGLSIVERRRIVTAFHSAIIPRRRAGRKPSEALTAAYADWKSNIRGVALFRKHILNWDRLSRWRRQAEQRSLMDAIYSRNRRERAQSDKLMKTPSA